MSQKQLTAAMVKKLPWPQVLFGDGVLTAKDAYDVGKLIVEKVWQGKFDRGHQRKEWSVRRLHDALGVGSPARYTRCVQVYEMANELKLSPSLEGVSVSTLFLVAGLPKNVRKKIAQQALKESWSKGRLEREIMEEVGPRRAGRPQGPAFVRALASCSNEPLLKDLDKLSSLDAATLRNAGKQVDKLLKSLKSIKQALKRA
jgi:hypothetical protein